MRSPHAVIVGVDDFVAVAVGGDDLATGVEE